MPSAAPSLRAASSLATFQNVSFKPSSPLKRAFIKTRGPIATILASLIFVAAGAYFWVDHHTTLASIASEQAAQAVEQEHFRLAIERLESAHGHYQVAFNYGEQANSLRKIGECQAALGEFELAFTSFKRARAASDSEELRRATMDCHLKSGKLSMQSAYALLKAGKFGDAVLDGNRALKHFKSGKADDSLLAKTERILALSYAGLYEFEAAETHLAQARELEGRSSNNLAAEKKVRKLALDFDKLSKTASRQSSVASSRRAKSAYRPAKPRTYHPPTTRTLSSKPRLTTLGKSSYPKYRPPETDDEDGASYSSGSYSRPSSYSRPTYNPRPANYDPRPTIFRPNTNRRSSPTYPKANFPTAVNPGSGYKPPTNPYKAPGYSPPSYKPPSYSAPSYSNPGNYPGQRF